MRREYTITRETGVLAELSQGFFFARTGKKKEVRKSFFYHAFLMVKIYLTGRICSLLLALFLPRSGKRIIILMVTGFGIKLINYLFRDLFEEECS